MKNIEEEKIKKYLKRLSKATLMDDLIFRQVCKSKTEKSIKNYQM